jgi:hypothetical protein
MLQSQILFSGAIARGNMPKLGGQTNNFFARFARDTILSPILKTVAPLLLTWGQSRAALAFRLSFLNYPPLPLLLLPLVLMLYYLNSDVIKQQVINQASKVSRAMCAWRLKVFVAWSSGTRL